MLPKWSFLFFGSAVLAAAASTRTSAIDLFPDFNSSRALKAQSEWIKILQFDEPAPENSAQPHLPLYGSNGMGTEFERDLIKYAQFSRAAYMLNSTKWNCPRCLDSTSYIHDTEVLTFFQESSYGYVAYHKRCSELIVAFGGTNRYADVLTDFDVTMTPWHSSDAPNAKVHSGAGRYYQSVALTIENTLTRFLSNSTKPVERIVFLGHSLGGQQAVLGSADFTYRNKQYADRVMVVTYGQPRVGNPEFTTWLDSQPFTRYRVTCKGDIAPRLPPAYLGYAHYGQEIYYTPSGPIRNCTATGEDPTCIDSFPLLKANFFDHGAYPGLETSIRATA